MTAYAIASEVKELTSTMQNRSRRVAERVGPDGLDGFVLVVHEVGQLELGSNRAFRTSKSELWEHP